MADDSLLSPQQDISSPGGAASPLNPSTKRKRGGHNGTSSRGVANLTPEQLARKRANDREAQRAIRERTKSQIDTLNQRIRDLESQQPYNDLQHVLRQKDAVQAENEDIRRRLASVMSLIQPLIGNQGGLHELAVAAERNMSQSLPTAGSYQSPDSRNHQSPYPPNPLPHNSPHNDQVQPDLGSSGQWTTPGSAPTSNMRSWPSENAQLESSRNAIQPDLAFPQSDERLGVEYLIDGNQGSKAPEDAAQPPQGGVTETSATVLIPASIYNSTPLPFTMLPRNLPATCPLDGVLLDYLSETRDKAAGGVHIEQLVGPLHPNFSALKDPIRNLASHPLSKLFLDILRTFPSISALPEQVAVVYVMFLLMRWQIEPTQENYDRMPDWLCPRPSQLFSPHAAWIDSAPWPKLRDRLAVEQPPQNFNDFFVPFTSALSVNWPHSTDEVLLLQSNSATLPSSPHSPAGSTGPSREEGNWIINPAFEAHIKELSNWSLGPIFASSLPRLADTVRIQQ